MELCPRSPPESDYKLLYRPTSSVVVVTDSAIGAATMVMLNAWVAVATTLSVTIM